MSEILKIIAVTGPTATGKTALAVALARRFDGEIVSVDSRQVYRRMDLGTGKDLDEYGEVKHHLIDIADPATEVYDLARFCRDASRAILDIAARGKTVILCGGTALYLAALLNRYELPGGKLSPREAGRMRERQNPDGEASFRLPFEAEYLVLGVLFPRAAVRERIAARLDARLAAGMIDEVRDLTEKHGVPPEKLEFFGLEYREISRYLRGACTREEMRATLLDRIRQFAKRQDIFFRKLEREGNAIHWLPDGDFAQAETLTVKFLAGTPLPPVTYRLADHPNPGTRRRDQN
ncbi:MAG: tRNA (adenosine(37)-N6)-dimethylallyltransferase MiaA [Lentisphaeria bacterium]|nr:tRNA (adenosine(37)-N6)-dimethylallyltransferase MiaA [Lentisphaeria bacterium]